MPRKKDVSLEQALAALDLPTSRAERETTFTRAADQRYWSVCSSDPSMIRKLWKAFGPGVRIDRGTVEWCNIPKAFVTVRTYKNKEELPPPTGAPDPREPRTMSWKDRKKLWEQEKEKDRLRLEAERKAREAKKLKVEESRRKIKAASKPKAKPKPKPKPAKPEPSISTDLDDLLDELL